MKGERKMNYGYSRCSTNEDKQDITRQIRELEEKGIKKENIYFEYASGIKEDRTELKKLLAVVKKGDTIIATEVSRITRSTKQLCEIIEFAKRRNPFRHVTVVLKKSAVIQSGNYRDFLWFEDYDLFVRILQKGYIAANIPECLVNVRADKDMFARRGGWQYLKQDCKFQKQILKTKYIGKTDFLINIIIRSIVRIIPNKLRSYLYKIFLRSES